MIARAVGGLLANRQQREQLSRQAQALVDGRGAKRVCRVLLGEPEGAWDREVSVSRQ